MNVIVPPLSKRLRLNKKKRLQKKRLLWFIHLEKVEKYSWPKKSPRFKNMERSDAKRSAKVESRQGAILVAI